VQKKWNLQVPLSSQWLARPIAPPAFECVTTWLQALEQQLGKGYHPHQSSTFMEIFRENSGSWNGFGLKGAEA